VYAENLAAKSRFVAQCSSLRWMCRMIGGRAGEVVEWTLDLTGPSATERGAELDRLEALVNVDPTVRVYRLPSGAYRVLGLPAAPEKETR
jgi:hypothetical protein